MPTLRWPLAWLRLRGHAFEVVDVPASAPAPAVPAKPNMAARRVPPANIPQLLPEQALAALTATSLMPLTPQRSFALAVPFGLEEYLDLVDTVGRVVHPQKRGAITQPRPRIAAAAWAWTPRHSLPVQTRSLAPLPMQWARPRMIKLACARQRRALRGMAASTQDAVYAVVMNALCAAQEVLA